MFTLQLLKQPRVVRCPNRPCLLEGNVLSPQPRNTELHEREVTRKEGGGQLNRKRFEHGGGTDHHGKANDLQVIGPATLSTTTVDNTISSNPVQSIIQFRKVPGVVLGVGNMLAWSLVGCSLVVWSWDISNPGVSPGELVDALLHKGLRNLLWLLFRLLELRGGGSPRATSMLSISAVLR